jgi:hypothetical protein
MGPPARKTKARRYGPETIPFRELKKKMNEPIRGKVFTIRSLV